MLAKQYDKVIEFYDSGLYLIPKEPVFLSNKSVALRLRGDNFHNKVAVSPLRPLNRNNPLPLAVVFTCCADGGISNDAF